MEVDRIPLVTEIQNFYFLQYQRAGDKKDFQNEEARPHMMVYTKGKLEDMLRMYPFTHKKFLNKLS